MPNTGAWSVTGKPVQPYPVDCQAAGALCLQVIYRVPERNIECLWTVFYTSPNAGPKVIDENADAAHYTMQTAFPPGTAFSTHGIETLYPPIVAAAHVEGPVRVEIVVGNDGKLRSFDVISGQPMLRAAAVQSARNSSFDPVHLGTQTIAWKAVLVYQFSSGGGRFGTVDSRIEFASDVLPAQTP
jgi:TonB family protein